jgi:hypothetical protein
MAHGGRATGSLLACVLAVVLAVGNAGCSTLGDARTDEQDRAAQVYEAVLRWFVPSVQPGDKAVIFIEPRGEGSSISLTVQSELIRELDDIADVRFIDTHDEALENDTDGVPHVRDGGLLLRLGPVAETGSPVTVDVDQFIGDDSYTSLRFVVGEVGDSWAVDGQPESVTTSVTTAGG